MYIVKNALRNIVRYKGRNILIGIIVLVISVSACISLSIKESAIKVKQNTLNSNTVTAQISLDRDKIMNNVKSDQKISKENFKNALNNSESLSLEELEKYATADSVKSFYYSASASLNAGTGIEPVDVMGTFTRNEESNKNTNETDTPEMPDQNNMQNLDKGFGRMGSQGDFTLIGYSSDQAMTDFVNGNSTITTGSMFSEGTEEYNCIINEQLATYNSLEVNDKIVLLNPNDSTEKVKLTVVGIYYSTAENGNNGMQGFSTSTDSANQILLSYNALNKITTASEKNAEEITDSTTGVTTTSSIKQQLSGTYVFSSKQNYETFKTQVTEMGLSSDYTVSSQDVESVELSLQPLENLSKMATYFLWVVLAIGTVILVVFNIFNIRERKYEIGVLTAIGMKKGKVALQFVTELFVFTFAAIIIGTSIGAVSSVPVTNSLLKSQIESNTAANSKTDQNFNRETTAGKRDIDFGMENNQPPEQNNNKNFVNNFKNSTVNYIQTVSYSTNLTVVLKLMGIGIGLTLVSSLAAVMFIMRYKPLRILSNRN